MRGRFKSFLAAMALSVATMLGAVVGVAPARAAVADCPSNYFCLFRWVNYGAGRWQINPATAAVNSCVNLSTSRYTDGSVVNNSSASYVDNASASYTIVFYDWVDCNETGDRNQIFLGGGRNPNLNAQGWYHRYTSFKLIW